MSSNPTQEQLMTRLDLACASNRALIQRYDKLLARKDKIDRKVEIAAYRWELSEARVYTANQDLQLHRMGETCAMLQRALDECTSGVAERFRQMQSRILYLEDLNGARPDVDQAPTSEDMEITIEGGEVQTPGFVDVGTAEVHFHEETVLAAQSHGWMGGHMGGEPA